GRQEGAQLIEISNPQNFKLLRKGGYNNVEVISNCKMIFEDIQLAEYSSNNIIEKAHISFKSIDNSYLDEFALYPEIYITGCKNFVGHLGKHVMDLNFSNCTINHLITKQKGVLPAVIAFNSCGFKPILAKEHE